MGDPQNEEPSCAALGGPPTSVSICAVSISYSTCEVGPPPSHSTLARTETHTHLLAMCLCIAAALQCRAPSPRVALLTQRYQWEASIKLVMFIVSPLFFFHSSASLQSCSALLVLRRVVLSFQKK
eukprot:RCo043614